MVFARFGHEEWTHLKMPSHQQVCLHMRVQKLKLVWTNFFANYHSKKMKLYVISGCGFITPLIQNYSCLEKIPLLKTFFIQFHSKYYNIYIYEFLVFKRSIFLRCSPNIWIRLKLEKR